MPVVVDKVKTRLATVVPTILQIDFDLCFFLQGETAAMVYNAFTVATKARLPLAFSSVYEKLTKRVSAQTIVQFMIFMNVVALVCY